MSMISKKKPPEWCLKSVRELALQEVHRMSHKEVVSIVHAQLLNKYNTNKKAFLKAWKELNG